MQSITPPPQLKGALTEHEVARLVRLETIVERGMTTFVEVGTALLKIKDERLYRDAYDTFEAYCRDRWQLSRSRAYQVIDAALVVGHLSTIVDTPPANEAQARPLAVNIMDEGDCAE